MKYSPDFEKGNGLVPAIVQDYQTGKVLMLGFLNKLAWEKTLETGLVHFYSRTRNKLWLKGETSGHYLILKEIYVDCDEDTVLLKVEPKGPVCH
ncbi:MAG: phosphoribosyl-AMP cyclohydrolase, partial [Thermodesulfobacterium geofontis]